MEIVGGLWWWWEFEEERKGGTADLGLVVVLVDLVRVRGKGIAGRRGERREGDEWGILGDFRRCGYGVLRQLENEGRDEMKEVHDAGKERGEEGKGVCCGDGKKGGRSGEGRMMAAAAEIWREFRRLAVVLFG
ncbi:hypothetical protein HAX54_012629 [Datura stramonium]|uniref:Uncharacterized protein n=1 Tax=Datura stramonium TaxID=4076 RepID=A0ABS8RYB0_DATST|nr:hypothetical protein [Datura stramonium]